MAVPICWAVCFAALLTWTDTARPRVDVASVRARASLILAKEEAANAADDVAHGAHINSQSTDGAADDTQVSALTSRTRLVDTKQARAQASLQKYPLETKNAIAHEDASVSNHSSFAEDLLRNHSYAVKMYSGNDTAGCDLRSVAADLKFVACSLINGVMAKLIDKAVDHIAGAICGFFSGQINGLCGQAAAAAGCTVGLVCPALGAVAGIVSAAACITTLTDACTTGVKALIPASVLKAAVKIKCTPSATCIDTPKFYKDYGPTMKAKIVDAIVAMGSSWCAWVEKEAKALCAG